MHRIRKRKLKEKDNKINSLKPKRDFKYYLVAYIDVLGQSSILSKLKKLPRTSEENIEFTSAVRDSYGFVRHFRDSFYESVELFKSYKGAPLPSWIPSEGEAILKKMKEMKVKIIVISDTVILYSPIRDDDVPCPQHGIFAVLASMANIFFSALAIEKPCRAGIELGTAIVHDEGDIYGYALYEAHRLESKVADYPRIVVGDELRNYLEFSRSAPRTDFLTHYSALTSQVCLELFGKDDDGEVILDYLGSSYKKYCFKESESTLAMFPESYRFIEECIKTFEKGKGIKDQEILKKYKKLKCYFEKNISVWQSEHTISENS